MRQFSVSHMDEKGRERREGGGREWEGSEGEKEGSHQTNLSKGPQYRLTPLNKHSNMISVSRISENVIKQASWDVFCETVDI